MTDATATRHSGRTIVAVCILVAVVFVGYRMLLPHADARKRDAQGNCLLQARVYTDGEGSQNPRRIFGMQNLDDVPWSEVQITITGVGTAESNAGRPSGTYVLQLPLTDAAIAAHRVREVLLDEFKSAEGPRWVAMTMRVTHATINAKIAGEGCHSDVDLPGSGSAERK